MLTRYLRYATLLPYLQADPGDGGGGSNDDPAANDQDPEGDKPLGEKGEAALKAERDARKAAEKRARDAQKELDDLKAAKVKADEEEQAEQGRWKELAEKREASLTETTTERDSLKAERDEYKALLTADVDASWKDLPEEVREAYDGEDDDVLAKKRHMARMAKVIQKLTAESGTPGNGPNPKPAGAGVDTEADKRARAAMRPRL